MIRLGNCKDTMPMCFQDIAFIWPSDYFTIGIKIPLNGNFEFS